MKHHRTKEYSWHSEDMQYGGVMLVTGDHVVLDLHPDSQLTLMKKNNKRIKDENTN